MTPRSLILLLARLPIAETALAVLALLLLPANGVARTYWVDPIRGESTNDGSREQPWRTLEEVVAKGLLARIHGGDTIRLRSGRHGKVVFSGDNDDFVTIEADEGARPEISYFEIRRGSKWHVDGLTISSSFANEPYGGVMLKIADRGDSSEIIVENCFVYDELDASKWSARDWVEANSGMFMGRHGSKHVFRNNYVLNTRFGISLCSEDSLCEGNVVSGFSGDGIRVTRDAQTVRHNVIRNIHVSAEDGDSNHDDAIQCFLFNKGTGTVRDVTVVENLIVMRENPKQPWPANMQAIGFFDGPLLRFRVEGNVINTSHWHGVSLYDAQDCVIRGNVVYSRWQDTKLRPWIRLGSKGKGPVRGNVVEGNWAFSFHLGDDDAAKAQDNRRVNATIHAEAQAKLLGKIEDIFGEVHRVSGLRRVAGSLPHLTRRRRE